MKTSISIATVLLYAGIIGADFLDEHTKEEWDKVVGVHLNGTFNTCKHAIPHMKRQKYGRILNTFSNAWHLPTGLIGYAAAKGGIVTLSWALAFELRPYGITVNVVAPFGQTRGHDDGDGRETKKFEAGIVSKELISMTPRDEDPRHAMPTLLFLLTPEADEINGCLLRFGGGKISRFSHPEETMVLWRDHKEDGPWTVDQLRKVLPGTLFAGSKKAPHLK